MNTPGTFDSSRTDRRPWWRRGKPVLTVLALIVLALVVWRLATAPHGKGGAGAGAVSVVTAVAKRGDFTVYESAVGSVTPLNAVTVRSQVTGRLVRVAFKGGEMVKQGQLLAEIDPQPFQINVDSARGELARDQAASSNAADTLQRYRQLLAEKSITPQQFANQEALAGQSAGDLQVAKSRLADAQLQLARTRITAPIDGMVGLARVNPGNVVAATDPGGLTTVTQLRPIGVTFALPGDALADLVHQLQANDRVPVAAYQSDNDHLLATGQLLAVNNEIDPATGTVQLKARFGNASSELFPNQFVTVKLPVRRLTGAVLVPTTAVQHGADGTFVYVVGKDRKAVLTPVSTGPGDGTTTVIARGIAPGAEVVVAGADQLRDGAAVTPVAASSAGAAAAGSGGQGAGRPQS